MGSENKLTKLKKIHKNKFTQMNEKILPKNLLPKSIGFVFNLFGKSYSNTEDTVDTPSIIITPAIIFDI